MNKIHKKILIVAAMSTELRPLMKLFAHKQQFVRAGEVYESKYQGYTVYMAAVGVGARQVNKRLPHIISSVPDVDGIIIVGVCGGVGDGLTVGTIILPECFTNESFEKIIPDIDFRTSIEKKGSAKGRVCGGVLLSGNRLFGYEDKRLLRQQHNEIVVVDMESFCVAQMAFRKKIPLIAIKAVSDEYNTVLPRESFLVQHMRKRGINKVSDYVRHPFESFKAMLLFKAVKKAVRLNGTYIFNLFKNNIL